MLPERGKSESNIIRYADGGNYEITGINYN